MLLSRLMEISREKSSQLILAVDHPVNYNLIRRLSDFVVAVKIGLPLIFEIGLDAAARMGTDYRIADIKMADVPFINSFLVEKLLNKGFDCVIAHIFPFSLEEPIKLAHRRGADMIGVLIMSHGAPLLEENVERLLSYGIEVGIDGLVIGATKAEQIRRVRELTDLPIISPGVIKQGAPPGEALRCGADFEIVGRAILSSENPVKTAEEIVRRERFVRSRSSWS